MGGDHERENDANIIHHHSFCNGNLKYGELSVGRASCTHMVCKPSKQQKDFRPQEVLHPQVKPFHAHLCFFKILSCSRSSASSSSEVPPGTHCELSTGGCLLTTSSMAHFSFHTPCLSTYKLNGVVSFCTL